MHQLLLSIFLVLPFNYTDYNRFSSIAALEGISVEEYIATYLKHVLEATQVEVLAEFNDEDRDQPMSQK